jgi:hypothetical protein
MKFSLFAAPLMVLFTMAGCSKTPSLPYALTDDFKRLGAGTSDMLMAFEEACPALSDGKANLASVSADKGLEQLPSPDLGWHKGATITFMIKDNATGGEHWARASGHTCQAYAGGGLKPGFLITKPTCATLCSGSATDRLFWPTSRTQFLESGEESAATEKQRLEAGANELKALEQKALKGDYQAQRNLAYGYVTGTFGSPFDPVSGCAWYTAIVASGNPQVNSTDQGNVRVYCTKLPQVDHERALQRSADLLQQINAAKQ